MALSIGNHCLYKLGRAMITMDLNLLTDYSLW